MHSPFRILMMLAVSWWAGAAGLWGQEMVYKRYTAESEYRLPSNEVYGILFDRNNVLWANTDRGVWRYDGLTSKQFTVHEGLKENQILRMFLDSAGTILLSSVNNHIYGIRGDSVFRHPLSEQIRSKGSAKKLVQMIWSRPGGVLEVCYNRPGFYRFCEGKEPEDLTFKQGSPEGSDLVVHYSPDDYYWYMTDFPNSVKGEESKVTTKDNWFFIESHHNGITDHYLKDLVPLGDREFLLSSSNKVYHLRDGKLVASRNIGSEVFTIHADRLGNFWVGTRFGGVLRFPDRNLNATPVNYLNGETVSGITQDHEGGYWFSTVTGGIFQSRSLDIGTFSNPYLDKQDESVTALASSGRNLYTGTESGLLFRFREQGEGGYEFKRIPLEYQTGPVRRILPMSENDLIVFNLNLLEIDTLGRYKGIGRQVTYPFECTRWPDGSWVASLTDEIRVFKNGKLEYVWNPQTIRATYGIDSTLAKSIVKIRLLMADPPETLWLGSQQLGLFSFSGGRLHQWSERDSIYKSWFSAIIRKGPEIWAGTTNRGIMVIRPDSSYAVIDQEVGLPSNIVDVLLAENDSVVWAGTNEGLCRITEKDGQPDRFRIESFSTSDGMPSNRIFSLVMHEGALWAGTSAGLVRINTAIRKSPGILPQLTRLSLLVNGMPVTPVEHIRLDPNQNNLVFNFEALTYRSPVPIIYQYQLDGIDAEPITRPTGEARYPDLGHGSYTFRINASYDGQFNPASAREITVHIGKHWYETRLAILLILALLVSVLLFSYRHSIKRLRDAELQQRKLLLAEKKSLISQMNPHFIFNSLNSIQHFIVQHDEVQANNYLTSFSGLIRKILDNSKKQEIPLAEEIATLALYLDLEQLRFEGNFEYHIQRDRTIDYNETTVPPMLIQPFVENAVWHGLVPRQTKGQLTISFINGGDRYICTVEDNGIGREMAEKIRTRRAGHISSGIRNVSDRIELLNSINSQKISLSITDLKDQDDHPAGTRVELAIPYNIKS